MNYSPGPGTVAFRVLAHLQTLPHGTEVMTAALADAIRTDHKQVLKAEPATADATDRGTPASASPDGGPMGVGQPAAAGPTGDQRRGPATGAQADGCRAPECHAGACSGRAQQDQTSLPASPMRIALWNDGALQVPTVAQGGEG